MTVLLPELCHPEHGVLGEPDEASPNTAEVLDLQGRYSHTRVVDGKNNDSNSSGSHVEVISGLVLIMGIMSCSGGTRRLLACDLNGRCGPRRVTVEFVVIMLLCLKTDCASRDRLNCELAIGVFGKAQAQ
jgi:hypothetical protein